MLLRLLFLAILLSGCATLEQNPRVDQLALDGHLQKRTMLVDGFVLTAYLRINDPQQALHVYIEGDGRAWLSRRVLSSDPTPRDVIGLALAAQDTASNVLYLARPCQYNNFSQTPCDSAYWSNLRFSAKVIDAMQQELQHYISATQHQKIHLIGYSGGATVAVLLAAKRNDVLSLRTVAGNLDHAYVNQIHRVDAMPASLNAIDVASNMSALPQLHFVGKNDAVIPKQVAERFIAAQAANQQAAHCAAMIEVNADHQKGWVGQWKSLLTQAFPC